MTNPMTLQSDLLALLPLLDAATPGPWQAKNEYEWDEIVGNIDGPDDGRIDYTCVCSVDMYGRDTDEDRANAALIVATVNLVKKHHAELAALARDGERLEWVSKQWGGHRREYCAHVMNRGGTGDLSDIRTFVDAAMANNQENGREG